MPVRPIDIRGQGWPKRRAGEQRVWAVYPVVDGKSFPVCEQAGFAPFGFGYRRCPGEQFTIKVFEDFLRKVWADNIEFGKLEIPDPERVPIGPGQVVTDDLGFSRSG
ncbi:MAG: hypothetical protein JO230_15270 [Xanthobacteraceae bacterium]|nr:hypothetical protein [Xanthobacteraceae bacterium]